MEHPSQVPTWMVVLRTTPPTFHSNSRVSPGIRELLMWTRHHAEAWKFTRPGTSTASVSLIDTVWSAEYVAYPMTIPSGVVIGIGAKSASVPSSLGTEMVMLSPAQ
ncbi:MAG: hypothetical protein NNC24_00585 [Candidatus Nanosynbacter sp. P11B_S7_bin.28.1]|nr:hypothetical protein [Candidatus Nanosynbacter sp. P11B_S7_bin.28.1]